MTTLFLDFASHKKMIALVRDGVTVAEVAIDDHAKEAETLPAIEGMLSRAGVRMDDLSRITSVAGPGGFMSLRVGLSLGNALAWSLGVPTAGVHLSDVWRARMPDGADALWLHSTKKDLLFIRGCGSLATEIPEPTLVTLAELQKDLRDSADFVGELIPEQAAALPVTMLEGVRPVSEILPALTDRLTYAQTPVLPWYGRGI